MKSTTTYIIQDNTFMKIENLDDLLQGLEKKNDRLVHLLVGNGFSMAYDPSIFSYNALHSFIENIDDPDLKKILSVVETKNFELIMQQLDNLAALVTVFDGTAELKQQIEQASQKLKSSLLNAVKSLHPEHVFKVSDEAVESCAKFLNHFASKGGSIFSTNYDLLLYWVLMRSSTVQHTDGFGREALNYEPGMTSEEIEWSDLYWSKHKDNQNIFYVHGALPFFDAGSQVVKEEYDYSAYLLEKISSRMDRGEYPIFVTAGNGEQKLAHIRHNQYLTFCYDKLSSITGTLITFGFMFGKYDHHIINAINHAAKNGMKKYPKLLSVYIGVYSDADKKHIEEIQHLFKVKVRIFDAKLVNIWGK